MTTLTRRQLLMHAAAGASLGILPRHAHADDADTPTIETLRVADAQLELQFAAGFDAPLMARARRWVERAAKVVIAYLGRFPVPRADVLLIPFDGAGIRNGVSYGEPSPRLRVRVGRETREAQFDGDWVLVHEMVHFAVPALALAHRWLHEGIATYVESLARTRAGRLTEVQLWAGFAKHMPLGQPRAGDEGLDRTHTWGRTYWGGAMFCLLADVEMRRRGGPRTGLQQALQGLLAAGGSYAVAWPVERVLAAADAAVGQATLRELYALMKDCARPVDLDSLWRDLGVERLPDGDAALHDEAPLSAVRRGITS